jgi:hypothetical protein
MKAEYFAPKPIDLLESNRNLGYTIEEAIADLVDNSISAYCSEVFIDCKWHNGNPYLAILDNGQGMDEGTLIESFRLGSNIPESNRSENDLGRFGMGMKTASLSQSRSLIVISKAVNHAIVGRTLDLEFVKDNGWHLKKGDYKSVIEDYDLNKKESGTILYWSRWDRAPDREDYFNEIAQRLLQYLGVVFNKFISDKSLHITINGFNVKAISPIPSGSQVFDESRNGPSGSLLNGYLLKHPLKWDTSIDYEGSFNSYNLFRGIDAQQGIYIYRCKRLLTPYGGWLGIEKIRTSSRLARVEMEYPNSADELWSLDITKTKATIPPEFREQIKRLTKATRVNSVTKISKGRNSVLKEVPKEKGRIWLTKENKDLMCYIFQPNINHHLFQNMIDQKKISKNDLDTIFSLLSENLPVSEIVNLNDDNSSKITRMNYVKKLKPHEKEMAVLVFKSFRTEGKSHDEAINTLLNCEPYCYHKEVIIELIKKSFRDEI